MQQQHRATRRSLASLLKEARGCRICLDRPTGQSLPHEPKPVLVAKPTARLCVAGQAPGSKVHRTGVPFNDPSGDRLRLWMNVDRAAFYDDTRVAIVPMGFCYPGEARNGGDMPPRPECAAAWHDAIFAKLPGLKLILAIGAYAHAYHLRSMEAASVTSRVRDWKHIMAATSTEGRTIVPLPHPSWRNSAWLSANGWFERELLPELRAAVSDILSLG